MLETSSYQILKEPTWLGTTDKGTSTSCIDHCYTNVPENIKSDQVIGVGNSDHLGIVVRKRLNLLQMLLRIYLD